MSGDKDDKKGGGGVPVVDYHMSMHYAIGHGVLDRLNTIYVKEEIAFEGAVDGYVTQFIDEPELFGGDEKEGGVKGQFEFYTGTSTQLTSVGMSARFGKTPATMPGFRGISYVFFHDFVWSVNNPFLPSVWLNVTRIPVGLNSSESRIIFTPPTPDGEDPVPPLPPDANPAHMLYECLTNIPWGMGAPVSLLDVPSFEEASTLLYAEDFGLSMIWAKQGTIQSFVEEILDHILAVLYLNPQTGLLTLRLLRDNYDVDVDPLRELTVDNCTVTKFSRKAWAETVNEINVTWTNPENEQSETLTFHDIANIAMQGGVVSDTRNYYGVRNSDLAAKLAVRDVRTASAPLASAEVEIDRSGWDILPGEVVKLSSPEDNLSQIIMRVGNVSYGKPGSMKITAVLTEDIFALEQAEWVSQPSTQWVDPGEVPAPLAYTTIMTPPRSMITAAGLSVDDTEYPRVAAVIFGQQIGTDTNSFQVYGPATLPNGDAVTEQRAKLPVTDRAELGAVMAQEATTVLHESFIVNSLLGSFGPQLATFAMLGTTEEDSELVMFDSYNSGTGEWTMARGVLDTVPKAWPIGTQIWFINNNFGALDITEVSANETVPYQLTPRTSKGVLPLVDAPVVNYTFTERPYLPSRPANVTIAGVQFGNPVVVTRGTVAVTWSNRNRLTEDTIIKRWTEGNVSPEVGQTTIIRLYDTADNLLTEYTGLTGTSYDIPWLGFKGHRFAKVGVFSARDGFESLQGVVQPMEFDLAGYGNDYGQDYG